MVRGPDGSGGLQRDEQPTGEVQSRHAAGKKERRFLTSGGVALQNQRRQPDSGSELELKTH